MMVRKLFGRLTVQNYQLHDRLATLEGAEMEQEVQAELCTLGYTQGTLVLC